MFYTEDKCHIWGFYDWSMLEEDESENDPGTNANGAEKDGGAAADESQNRAGSIQNESTAGQAKKPRLVKESRSGPCRIAFLFRHRYQNLLLTDSLKPTGGPF
jgi:hypothetical protein